MVWRCAGSPTKKRRSDGEDGNRIFVVPPKFVRREVWIFLVGVPITL